MEINIIKKFENKLLSRDEYEFSVDYDGATPKRIQIRDKLTALVNSNPNLTIIKKIFNRAGVTTVLCRAHVYINENDMRKVEPKYAIERHAKKDTQTTKGQAKEEAKEKPKPKDKEEAKEKPKPKEEEAKEKPKPKDKEEAKEKPKPKAKEEAKEKPKPKDKEETKEKPKPKDKEDVKEKSKPKEETKSSETKEKSKE